MILEYLRQLNTGRLILWCYLIWYLMVLIRYFDPRPSLWLTSLGLSGIIGYALYLSTAASGKQKLTLDRWQLFRLFLMPFCISSFAALVKNEGFILIFSPKAGENMAAVILCFLLVGTVKLLQRSK
ncbi:MAG: hypothetical protein ACO1QS_08185 [Verrucomicrobiota bacterium]